MISSATSEIRVTQIEGKRVKKKVLARKIDDTSVTRNSLSGIRVLALQVFEACSKTCNAKIKQKNVRASMSHGINF